MNLNKSQYRPDIDGLRALAVLAVLVFHIDPKWLPGGFLGVDVFFVISGFLITSIITREIQAGDFSFVRFYERRIRRIVPALVAVLIAATVAALVWWSPTDLKNYGRSMERTMVGMSNLYFLNAVQDYFNDEANVAPLLHTWSLAVEEQYYFVFPILLFALFSGFKSWRPVVWILAGVFSVSFGLCVWRGLASPMASFFLLPFRGWEMLAGSFLALSRFKASYEKTATAEGLAGMLLILGSFVFLNEKRFAPGISALPSCLGAALLIRSGVKAESPVAKVLSWKPLVFIGLISYSVYLWHWPLIVFARSQWGDERSAPIFAGLFATSLLLGWVSWKWIEQPFRLSRKIGRKSVWLFWGAATSCLFCFGAWLRHTGGLPDRFPLQVRELLAYKQPPSFTAKLKDQFDPTRAPVYGDSSVVPRIALWGDSHAEALIPAFDKLAKEYHRSFKYYGLPGQVPILGMIRQEGPEPLEQRVAYAAKVFDVIAGGKDITTVVLHGRWSTPNRGRRECRGEDSLRIYQRQFNNPGEMDAYYLECIHNMVERLLVAGKHVIFIGPVPELGLNVPDLLARQALRGQKLAITTKCEDFGQRHGYLLNALNSLEKRSGVTVILPHECLMDGDETRISFEGKPLYRDDDHLSSIGAGYLMDLWRPIFLENAQSSMMSSLKP